MKYCAYGNTALKRPWTQPSNAMSTTPPSSMRRFSSGKISEHRTHNHHLDNTKSRLKQYGNPISSTRIVDSSTSVEVVQGSRKRKWKAVGIEDRLQKPKGPHSRVSNLRRAPSGPPSNPLSAMALPPLPQTPMKLRPHHLTTKRSEENANSLAKVNNSIGDIMFKKEEISRRSEKIRLRNRVSLSDPARNLENQNQPILNEQTAAHVSGAFSHYHYPFETPPQTYQPVPGYTGIRDNQPVALQQMEAMHIDMASAMELDDWPQIDLEPPTMESQQQIDLESPTMESQQQMPQRLPYGRYKSSSPRGIRRVPEIVEWEEWKKWILTTPSETGATQKTSSAPNQIFTHFTITQDRTTINTDMLLMAVQNQKSSFKYGSK